MIPPWNEYAVKLMMIIILLLMLTLWITACAGGTKKAMGKYRGCGNHIIIEVVGKVISNVKSLIQSCIK